jgi:hypothetical protein
MKALLVTIFKVPNYGSVLQAYATQQTLENMGIDVEVLDYDHTNSEWSVAHGMSRQGLKNKIGRLLGLKPHHRKAKKLKRFADGYLHLTRPCRNHREIKNVADGSYDLYIVGSDQVWNTRFTNCDPTYYLLDFVTDNTARCISLSSSFASKVIGAAYRPTFEKALKKFSHLSVRENNGVDILRGLGHSGAKLVLDPTLMLSSHQWDALRDKKAYSGEKYILLYMLTYAFEPRPLIFEVLDYYQKKLGCKIIALDGHEDCCGQTDLEIEDATDSSISDFLTLFANASLVVTSSFHGTAFALNYGRPLVSVTPSGGDDRQSNVLVQLGLLQCRLSISGGDLDGLNPFYDMVEEQKSLQRLRDNSLNWIKQALE